MKSLRCECVNVDFNKRLGKGKKQSERREAVREEGVKMGSGGSQKR